MSLNCYFLLLLFARAYFGSSEGLQKIHIQAETEHVPHHDSIPTSIEPELIFVEGGTFSMGSNNGESDEQPVHSVQLDGYWIGKYEVTQAQWKEVMGTNPSSNVCDQCPVEMVSWNDAQEFIRKLNAQTGQSYRLPTEAEWEYAARGGNNSKGYTYAGGDDLAQLDQFNFNGGTNTHFVGIKQANELGIYDMAGNVSEWCSDRFDAYRGDDLKNPIDSVLGDAYVIRGGRWSDSASLCRNTNRSCGHVDISSGGLGLRLALSLVQ